jgi:hypothetical protein
VRFGNIGLGRMGGNLELSDVPAQLPQDYDVLLPRAGESESAAAVQVVELVALVG